jgi:hypothetical protein
MTAGKFFDKAAASLAWPVKRREKISVEKLKEIS